MKSFDQQVLDWARGKPADEVYDYTDPCGCALHEFLLTTGMAEKPEVGPFDWRDGPAGNIEHLISHKLGKSLSARPHTFGALADRLSA